MILSVEDTASAELTYDTTVFLETGKVVYSSDDASVMNVDENGNVTAVGSGTATLTATLLPSGRETSVQVRVLGDSEVCPKDDSCPISKFTDAKADAWYHDGVHWALEEGVMKGTGEKTFAPNEPGTRAMIVTMLWRMEGEPEMNQKSGFQDVNDTSWYADAVSWAVENNITKGVSETKFAPDQKVTREQFATFLYRYAESKGVDVSSGANTDLSKFTDASTISGFAVRAIAWAVAEGIITGMTETTIAPVDQATRAQIATMFMRYAQLGNN